MLSRHPLRPRCLLSALLLCPLVAVQFPGGAAAQQPTDGCTSAGYREFDFWIGEWEVFKPDGTRAGANRIEPILGGCALLENWQGASGGAGKSLNQYSSRDGKWRQSWVDAAGSRLDLVGGREGERMVMRGDGVAADGGALIHEISWEPLGEGEVKQHWRVSRDGGQSWSDAFVGIYRPTAAKGSSSD